MKAKKEQRRKSSILLTMLLLSNIFIVVLPHAISDNQVNISFLPLKNEPPDVPKISSPLNGSVNITIPVTLEVKVPKRKPIAKTIMTVFPQAELFEREAHDLFDVEFEGNPRLHDKLFIPDEDKGSAPYRKGGHSHA